jgi:hypothetical protein
MARRATPTLAAVGCLAIRNARLAAIRKELLELFVHNRDNL